MKSVLIDACVASEPSLPEEQRESLQNCRIHVAAFQAVSPHFARGGKAAIPTASDSVRARFLLLPAFPQQPFAILMSSSNIRTAASAGSDPAPGPSAPASPDTPPTPVLRASFWLGTLIIGYIGVYLCRKNLSVAVPLLQEHFNVSQEEVGKIASVSTLAYAVGKLVCGPIVDRVGGRIGFLLSLSLVALFGAIAAFSPSLFLLGLFYSVNRFAGAGSWGAMVKMTSDWFSKRHRATAMAWLSISYVVGGACATLIAGWISKLSHNNWRAVMGIPSLLLLAIVAICFFILPRTGAGSAPARSTEKEGKGGIDIGAIGGLFLSRQFIVILSLSFTYTMLRETFNFWTVDFLYTQKNLGASLMKAAFLSSFFDAFGILGILLMGRIYDKVPGTGRNKVMCAFGLALAGMLIVLPVLPQYGMAAVAAGVGLIGFLVYAPYSLFAGVMAVDVHGKQRAATVSGLIDAAGYLAGWLSGQTFGKILKTGGYQAGFFVLAGMMCLAALLSLLLRPNTNNTSTST